MIETYTNIFSDDIIGLIDEQSINVPYSVVATPYTFMCALVADRHWDILERDISNTLKNNIQLHKLIFQKLVTTYDTSSTTNFKHNQNINYTFIYAINDDYTGGEFYYTNDGIKSIIKIEKNTAIYFDNSIVYGFNPIIDGDFRMLVGFQKDKISKLTQTIL